ncbi:MAG: peptidase [Candidatus Parabeggiatoa sp. nov. 1]|nr:MAG: peptidase [Gammaproteobacteria bacterium]
MIKSFVHKGLERFYHSGSKAGIQARHAVKLRRILIRLDVATCPDDMDLPGFHLHELKGGCKGTWSVTVQANWRVTFRFVGMNTEVVNYEDYH